MSTLRLSGLKAGACSGLTLSGASLPHLERRGLAPPNGSSPYLRSPHNGDVSLDIVVKVRFSIYYIPKVLRR